MKREIKTRKLIFIVDDERLSNAEGKRIVNALLDDVAFIEKRYKKFVFVLLFIILVLFIYIFIY